MSAKHEKVDFIGIGAIKSGSTWVAECLRQHPEVAISSEFGRKEVRFFNTPTRGGVFKKKFSFYNRGIDWYLDQIPVHGEVRGEYSVGYLPDPKAPGRIYKHFPTAKLLVILRNPVDMIYSFYWHLRSGGHVHLSSKFSTFFENTEYKKLGLYYQQLFRYYNLFPKENIHIMLFKDLKEQPRKLLNNLYSFLSVSSDFEPEVVDKKVNKSFMPRFKFLKNTAENTMTALRRSRFKKAYSAVYHCKPLFYIYSILNKKEKEYPPLRNSYRTDIYKFYAQDIVSLESLLGLDLQCWKGKQKL